VVDRIKLVNPPSAELTKSNDGLIRLKSGATAEADANVKVISGALETSNVNIVNAMVNMINLSRSYEMQVKMMKTVQENDQATDQLLRSN
jgi:flagellar basal-body rod protein FlgF